MEIPRETIGGHRDYDKYGEYLFYLLDKVPKSVLDAFKLIADGKILFISRGDKSGTHTKELSLWPKELGITDDPESFRNYQDWYISSNAGMGVCLAQAVERDAYILSDKATFLTFKANGSNRK